MLIEVYNSQGHLVLDNETKVVKKAGVKFSVSGGVFFGRFVDAPHGALVSDWVVNGKYANNPNASAAFAISIGVKGYTGNMESNAMFWARPKNNSSILLSDRIDGVQVDGGTQSTIVGSGVEYVFSVATAANDVSGLIDCYDDTGQLLWSLNSLINTPQIVAVYNTNTTRVMDLNDFPEEYRENLFFYSTFAGYYDVPDESSAYYDALNIRRVNNLIYFGNIDGNGLDHFVVVAYIA